MKDETIEEHGNFNDYLKSLEYDLLTEYEQHIDFLEKVSSRIRSIAFKYDLPIDEYEKALRLIEQYRGMFKEMQSVPIGFYAINPNGFDSVKATFDEREQKIKSVKKLFKSFEKIIKGTIDKIKKQETTNSQKEKRDFTECGPNQTLPMGEESKKEKKLLMREIALIYWYDRDNLSFSKSIAQQIAEQHKHTSRTSGQSLYQDHYLPVSNDEKQRTHNDTSVQYLNNIIPILITDRGKKEANEDLKKAQDFQEKKKNKLF